MTWRRSTWVWIAVTTLLSSIVIQLMLVLFLLKSYQARNWPLVTPSTVTMELVGDHAASTGWPASGPPGQAAWPAPTHYRYARLTWLIDDSNVWRLDPHGVVTHSMDVIGIGFPAALVQYTRRHWPDEDAYWTATGWPDMSWGICVEGFVLNTLLMTALSLAAIWAPRGVPALISGLIRRGRLKRGLCTSCKYPIGVSPTCTECGASLPQLSPATTPIVQREFP